MTDKGNGSGIPILNWFDEPVRQSVNSVFDGINRKTEAMDLFRKYRKRHFGALKKTLGRIKILGMSDPIALTQIYSPAHVSTTIHSRLYEKEWYNATGEGLSQSGISPRKHSEIKRADEYVESHDRVVVLGGAGSGKTTFLRHLALAYCDKHVFETTNLKQSKFPIYVSMLAYAQRKDHDVSLLKYIVKELEDQTDKYAADFIHRVLDKGLAVVMLDALDEVPLSERTDVLTEVKSLCHSYPHAKFVISCRTADYIGGLETFYEVELAKLSRDAVITIIKAWFSNDEHKANKLLKHLKHDTNVQSLTETPLILSLLCIQFHHDLTLPKRRTEIYRRCIDAFLRDWDTSRGFRRDTLYTNLSDERKERIFEHVAGRYFVNRIQYHFPENELADEIGTCCERFGMERLVATSVLNEIERHHGILERFSVDSFAFSHPSFQEYFAARYLLSKRTELDAIRLKFDETPWMSTIEFIVSMHEDPSNILRFLMEQSKMGGLKNYPAMARRTRRLWLLYRCMNGGPAIDAVLRGEIYKHLVDSQIEMSNIYQNGGVFPIPVLMEDGVKHTFVYFHKRPSLYKALQPSRVLANEILLAPSEEYAMVAVDRLKQLWPMRKSRGPMNSIAAAALALCIAIPIASIRPKEVQELLATLAKDSTMPAYFMQIAGESQTVLRSR